MIDYVINLSPIFFIISMVVHLAYIEYELYQIWCIYMQYFRCCDLSNKTLFIVIQSGEVLLNLF